MNNLFINDFILIENAYYNINYTVMITQLPTLHNKSIQTFVLESTFKDSQIIGDYILFDLEVYFQYITKITDPKTIKKLKLKYKTLLLQQS